METETLDRLPKLESDSFLQLVDDFRRAVAHDIVYEANKKRPYPPNNPRAGEIFSAVLHNFSKGAQLWPGWERWVGPYARKCAADDSLKLASFAGKILLVALAVIAALFVYGWAKGTFAEMRWLPFAAAAWIVFTVGGISISLKDWLRYRGTEWPSTPDEAEKWHSVWLYSPRP